MYARFICFCVADVGSLGRGQAHTVHGTPSALTKAAAQTAAKLCNTRAIRYWLGNARSSGAPQSYAGVAG